MAKTDNKSIFFLTLSFICIWVILDNIFGKKYLDNFLSNVFPFYNSSGGDSSRGGNVFQSSVETVKIVEEKVEDVVVNDSMLGQVVDKIVDKIEPATSSKKHQAMDKTGDNIIRLIYRFLVPGGTIPIIRDMGKDFENTAKNNSEEVTQ